MSVLKALREKLTNALGAAEPEMAEQRDHALRLATATLLIEIVRADYHENLTENAAVFNELTRFFQLTEYEAELLVREAELEADQTVTLQGLTRLLHERLTTQEKHAVVEMLWRVALADDHLDKHEDHLVRKLADLLYVSHGDLIRIRNLVLDG